MSTRELTDWLEARASRRFPRRTLAIAADELQLVAVSCGHAGRCTLPLLVVVQTPWGLAWIAERPDERRLERKRRATAGGVDLSGLGDLLEVVAGLCEGDTLEGHCRQHGRRTIPTSTATSAVRRGRIDHPAKVHAPR